MSKPMHPNPSRSEAAGKNICQHRIRSNLASAFVALFRLKERGQGWVWIWNRLQLEKSMRFMGFGRRVHIFGVVFPSKRILPLCVSVLRPTPPDCYLHPPHLIIFTINLQMGACLNHSLLQQRSTQDKDFSEKTKTGHLEQIGIWFLLELFGAWLPFYTHLRMRGCGRESYPSKLSGESFGLQNKMPTLGNLFNLFNLLKRTRAAQFIQPPTQLTRLLKAFCSLRWVRLSCES